MEEGRRAQAAAAGEAAPWLDGDRFAGMRWDLDTDRSSGKDGKYWWRDWDAKAMRK